MKKVILLIMDGIGINQNTKGNAVSAANTPNLDYLFNNYPHSLLEASGKEVGLPPNQVGNSEVGHLNIGAGRVVYTGLSIINNAIENKSFFSNQAFLDAIKNCKENNSTLHLVGLVSHGGVHSSWEHLLALLDMIKSSNINVALHAISDGRDTKSKVFLDDLKVLLPILENTNVKLASIGGRFYGLDRDKNFDRVIKQYNAMTHDSISFSNPLDYVEESYKNGISDEFIIPAFNNSYSDEETAFKNNDSVIFFNFRPDRARELSHLIQKSDLYDYQNDWKQNIYFVTMMNYEGIEPNAVAFPPMNIVNGLGETIEKNNLSQLRIAETEKYAHVTFFFDGGKDVMYQKEEKTIINSPKVLTYNLKPEMSAYDVCDNILNKINNFDVIIANFANGDMVGHTGDFDATKKAVEVVDECVGKIYQKANENNITLFILADHGNADIMLDDNDEIVTSHTISPVPFIITNKNVNVKNGRLSNVAPTILKFMNIEIPQEMDEPLI